ncbi:MAG: DUF4282 domain-containing protein, partial [Acidimicrobiales bacterium]
MSQQITSGTKGFFASLFDFSFESWITPKIIKVVYAIVIVFAGLMALLFVVGAFRVNAVVGVFTLLIIAPLLFFFYVIIYRVGLEVVMAIFAIAENTRHLRVNAAPASWSGPGTAGPPPGWTPPTPAGPWA